MIQLSSSLSKTANLPMDIRKKIKQEKTIGALTVFKVGFLKILDYWSLPSCTFIFLWFHFSPRYYFWHYFLLIVTALGCHMALSCESWHFEMVPLSRGVTHFFCISKGPGQDTKIWLFLAAIMVFWSYGCLSKMIRNLWLLQTAYPKLCLHSRILSKSP